MAKKHFGGIYKTAREITPEHLLEFYLCGDQQERREAGAEILRRLVAYEVLLNDYFKEVAELHKVSDLKDRQSS